MPQPIIFICTKCNFRDSSISTWGKHLYLTNNDQILIDRSLAICYSCNSIVSAELLPTQKRIQSFNIGCNHLKKKYYEEVNRLEGLGERKSPARCLACGSHDFELIPNLEPDREQRKSGLPIRTGLFHRNCGGRIYAEFRAPNFFMGDKLTERIYDIEGIEIEDSKP